MSPYAVSKRGNKYLTTAIDHFSKWVEAVAIADQSAPTIARAVVTKMFARHGVPKMLLSYQGRNFTSDLVKEVCNLLGVTKLSTSPYNPKCNGQIENFHKTLHSSLACFLERSGQDWEQYVDYVLWAYRSQPHSVTKFSPYYLLYGREMAGPTENMLQAYIRSKNKMSDAQEAVKELAKKMKEARHIAWDNIRKGKVTEEVPRS
jgi:transposase InsO family protein